MSCVFTLVLMESLIFYEDENDNYNYEKGQYSTFTLTWDNEQKKLSISSTKGNYPDMLKKRMFYIVVVNGEHGSGPLVTTVFDKIVKYEGKAMFVKL